MTGTAQEGGAGLHGAYTGGGQSRAAELRVGQSKPQREKRQQTPTMLWVYALRQLETGSSTLTQHEEPGGRTWVPGPHLAGV